jgi:hypothetical protein
MIRSAHANRRSLVLAAAAIGALIVVPPAGAAHPKTVDAVPTKTLRLLSVFREKAETKTPKAIVKANRDPQLKIMVDQVRHVANPRVRGARPLWVAPASGPFAVVMSIPSVGAGIAGTLDQICSGTMYLVGPTLGSPGTYRLWGLVPDAVTRVVATGASNHDTIRAYVKHNTWSMPHTDATTLTYLSGTKVYRTISVTGPTQVLPCPKGAGTPPA